MGDQLPPIEALYPLFWKALHAAVYVAGAALLSVAVNWAFTRFQRFTDQMRRDRGSSAERVEFEKQSATISTTARKFVILLVWILAAILTLREFDFDVGPLLAGAGVAGLAIGFAAQNLLKDVFSGLFLLAEGHIRINDVVKIDNVSGTVEELTLRTTVLRSVEGAIHVFSNGTISNFTNLTRSYAYHVIEFSVSFGEDIDRAIAAMQDAASGLAADAGFGPMILEPIEVLGVDRFVEQGVLIKARIKTLPNQQWKVGREFNRRFLVAMRAAGIQIATAQRQIQISHALIDPEERAAIKSVVEEVLDERSGRSTAPPR